MNHRMMQGKQGPGLIVDWANDGDASSVTEQSRLTRIMNQVADARTRKETRRKKTSRVSFSKSTECVQIHGRWQMTHEEMEATWYSPEDRDEMKKELKETVKVMRRYRSSDLNLKDPEYCSRGLEHLRSSAILIARQEELHNVIGAVLNVQDDQWRDGRTDPLAVASASLICTKHARDRAASAGASDAAEAEVLPVAPSAELAMRTVPRVITTAKAGPQESGLVFSTLASVLEVSTEDGNDRAASRRRSSKLGRCSLHRQQRADKAAVPRIVKETPAPMISPSSLKGTTEKVHVSNKASGDDESTHIRRLGLSHLLSGSSY